MIRWEEGRLVLPNGHTLDVRVNGPRAAVRWADGALELMHGDAPAESVAPDHTIELTVRHAIEAPDVVWVPHLTPEPENVVGDWVFRSPAVILANREIVIALIVDVDDLRAARVACDGTHERAWLDYDHPRSTSTLAWGAYRQDGHVFFVREPLREPPARDVRLRLHVIASTTPDDLENPYAVASRFCWERWGRAGHARAAVPPFARHMDRIVRWAFTDQGWGESVWQPVMLGEVSAGAPVFIVDVNRHPSVPPERRTWREPRSIWNQVWFSTQRCANGLLRYARQIASADLEGRARQMTEIALGAPQDEGLFPAVLIANDDGEWRWSTSDRRPPSASERACHVASAAFTSRMLLEWHTLTGDARALAYVRRFAERLVALQRESGAFPGWVEPDGRVPAELAEGPESAVSTTLLFELADAEARAGDARRADFFRAASLRALPLLEGIARDGRWEDFETYYSCAPWGARDAIGRRVPRNGVYKQNTLSIGWCAETFTHAWRASRDPSHLRRARRCLDELSLYQAVWDPPFLPAPAHGGFGVMNADSEWNDARQSLFAPIYLEVGRETGDEELIERGVSALRASFSMLYCPENAAVARAYEQRFPFFGPESYGFMMENQGHDVSQPIGTFTIFAWGNGSALAAVATARDHFPEIARRYGFAIRMT